jgi:hypothetical protein
LDEKEIMCTFCKKKKTPVTLYRKVQKFSKSNGASPHQNMSESFEIVDMVRIHEK